MDDDMELLHPRDAVVHGIGAFQGGTDVGQGEPGELAVLLVHEALLELVDGLRLGRVRPYHLLGVAHLGDALGDVEVGHAVLVHLVEDPHGVRLEVDCQSNEGVLADRVSEVEAEGGLDVLVEQEVARVEELLLPV